MKIGLAYGKAFERSFSKIKNEKARAAIKKALVTFSQAGNNLAAPKFKYLTVKKKLQRKGVVLCRLQSDAWRLLLTEEAENASYVVEDIQLRKNCYDMWQRKYGLA